MAPTEIFKIMLLVLLVACAIGAALSKKLLTSVIIFMSYSGIMAIVWAMLQSPDLAVTEAAVGAGVSSILFFVCLRLIGRTEKEEDGQSEEKASREKKKVKKEHSEKEGGSEEPNADALKEEKDGYSGGEGAE